MAKLNGKDVQFYTTDGSDIIIDGQIEATISCSNPIIEDTDKNDTSRSILGQAVPSYTCEMTVHFDAADAGQDAVRTAISAGSSITLKRYDSGSSVATATGYVTEYSLSAPTEEIITANITVELDGDGAAFL